MSDDDKPPAYPLGNGALVYIALAHLGAGIKPIGVTADTPAPPPYTGPEGGIDAALVTYAPIGVRDLQCARAAMRLSVQIATGRRALTPRPLPRITPPHAPATLYATLAALIDPTGATPMPTLGTPCARVWYSVGAGEPLYTLVDLTVPMARLLPDLTREGVEYPLRERIAARLSSMRAPGPRAGSTRAPRAPRAVTVPIAIAADLIAEIIARLPPDDTSVHAYASRMREAYPDLFAHVAKAVPDYVAARLAQEARQ